MKQGQSNSEKAARDLEMEQTDRNKILASWGECQIGELEWTESR